MTSKDSSFFFLFSVGYSGSSGTGAVILDDCNFHESVHMENFDVDRTLSLVRAAVWFIRFSYYGRLSYFSHEKKCCFLSVHCYLGTTRWGVSCHELSYYSRI